jgi:hypothetical protein
MRKKWRVLPDVGTNLYANVAFMDKAQQCALDVIFSVIGWQQGPQSVCNGRKFAK